LQNRGQLESLTFYAKTLASSTVNAAHRRTPDLSKAHPSRFRYKIGTQEESPMPDSKTTILDDLPTDHDALDFTPYVETLVDVCKSGR